MSGYLMLSKDLPGDPRFRRLVRGYRNASALQDHEAVTPMETSISHMLGALAQLWIYADTHIREDNTLDVSADEIDELVGIPGFSQLLPADWLKIVDTDRVELPDFLEHNGTQAKKKAFAAKRQEKFRATHKPENSNAVALEGVTPSVTAALPSLPFPSLPTNKNARARAKTSATPSRTENGHADPAADAWSELIASSGAKPKRDAKVQAALAAVGGWSAIRMRTEFNASKLRDAFCAAYRSAA